MMEIVIDTSAVIAVLLREPSRPAVLAATVGTTLAAPPSLEWEVGNALAAMFKRKKISLPEAVRAIEDFLTLPIGRRAITLERAVGIASQLNVYAYDAYMVACAQQYGLPLLTLDRGLSDAARRAGVGLVRVQP